MRLILRMLVVALLSFVSLSSAARAQGVLPKSIDTAGTMAFNGQGGVDGNMHPSFGLSGGYNFWNNLTVLGEFEYQPFGATLATRQTIQLVGGGVRYYFMPSQHMSPYVVGSGGFARIGTNSIGLGINSSQKGAYFAAGGGVSFYVGDNWGVRPELRFQRELQSTSVPFNEVQGSISLFYQFGGTEAKGKKK